jgi:glycosyltransferase involved in cell wall biosynthesis
MPGWSHVEVMHGMEVDFDRSAEGVRSLCVTHFGRRPYPGQFSIEKVFEQVRQAWLDPQIKIIERRTPFYSRGFWPRLSNCLWASKRQSDLNHITGDVHYIALCMAPESTILTVHDCLTLRRLVGIRRWVFKRYWFDLPIKRVAAVTVVSNEVKRELEALVPAARNKTVVIPCSAAPVFKPCPRAFNQSRPRILQIGVTPNKNLGRLFAALTGMNCELQVIGRLSDSDMDLLQRSRIPFVNKWNLSDQELYECYCSADVVSFPSVYEGFGLPIIEAQWVERAVVTSNCSSMAEVAGSGACLVDPYDVDSIRNGFRRVLEDADYRDSIINGGIINRERFSYRTVAQQYAELYRKIAHAGTKPFVQRMSQSVN